VAEARYADACVRHSDRATAPCAVEARGTRRPDHKAEVVAYLRAGEPTFLWMTTAGPDYVSPGLTFGGDGIHTDVVYGWPSTLEGYVERYDVELPAAFEEPMRRNGWRIPQWVPPLIREAPSSSESSPPSCVAAPT
jgi:hypothetical protein